MHATIEPPDVPGLHPGSKPIILLDYVMTLVENTRSYDAWRVRNRGRSYRDWIAQEEYRMWLVELVRNERVILITARRARYRFSTLARLTAALDWEPMEAFFNEHSLPPARSKKEVLESCIYPRWGRPGESHDYLALESNVSTRAMYRGQGIAALPVPYGPSVWSRLPRIV